MITIIAGTDRTDSNTQRVAKHYFQLAQDQGLHPNLLLLSDLPPDFFQGYAYGTLPASFEQYFHKTIAPVPRFLFVVPEYNGSFPGILKLFIDIIPPAVWTGKRIALCGVATGRAGNLRGLDHFTAVMHYLRAEVYHLKPPLSSIHLNVDKNGELVNAEYLALTKAHLTGFAQY